MSSGGSSQRRGPRYGTFSSSLSRSTSHAGSAAFYEVVHPNQYEVSDNRSVSLSSSPRGSFGTSYWASRDGIAGDFASGSSDSISRTPEHVSQGEHYVPARATFSDTFGCSKESTSLPNDGQSSFHRNYSGTYSLSRKGPRGLFGRQKSDSRASFRNAVQGGGAAVAGQKVGGMDWSMQAFSQLVAFSQREGFGLSYNPDTTNASETVDEGFSSSLERIQARSLPSPHHHLSSEIQRDGQRCGMCSRWLRHKSPWSSQRMLVGNRDLPVVGVLMCGHVFHADCLEKDVPEILRHDPPCPQCNQYEDAAEKATYSTGVEILKAGNVPVKMRFPKIGPQLWRRSLRSTKYDSSRPPDEEKERTDHRGKGFFNRSLSKKQFPFLPKVTKDACSSRKVNSAAQVSPENQT